MKKILTLIIASLIISACKDTIDEKKILLSNNYNMIIYPYFTPNKKPIKKQKIIINYAINNQESNITIESNSDGFITRIFVNGNKTTDIDYNNSTMIIKNDKTILNHQLSLDDKNNIINILDTQNKKIVSTEMDKKGRITKMEGELLGKEKLELYQYSNSRLKSYSIKTGNTLNNSFIGELAETSLIYNNKNELIKSITNNYILTNEKKWFFSPENEKFKNNHNICFYSSHNRYGDWTKAYCLNLANEETSSCIRILEY